MRIFDRRPLEYLKDRVNRTMFILLIAEVVAIMLLGVYVYDPAPVAERTGDLDGVWFLLGMIVVGGAVPSY